MVPTLRRAQFLDHLKTLDPFKACSMAELRKVDRLSEYVRVGQGEVLLREGWADRELFLILTGSVEVTQAGRRVNTLGPCDFFGELAALNRGTRNATVTALSDLELLIIGPRELDSMAQISGFRDVLLKGMANRLRVSDARVAAESGSESLGGPETARQGVPSRPFTNGTRPMANESH